MFVPAVADLAYEMLRWFRYHTVYRSAWAIDIVKDRIKGGPDEPTVIDTLSADNRHAAGRGVECLSRLLTSKGFEALREPELAPLGIRPQRIGSKDPSDNPWSDDWSNRSTE